MKSKPWYYLRQHAANSDRGDICSGCALFKELMQQNVQPYAKQSREAFCSYMRVCIIQGF